MKLEANTATDYWTVFYNPSDARFPGNVSVEATTHPVGLFVTVKKVGDRIELLSRAKYYEQSDFGASLYKHLTERFGSEAEAFTCVIRHKFLPETIGRSAVIRALNENDQNVHWHWFDLILMDCDGDWPCCEWSSCNTPSDIEALYQQQPGIEGSSGLLLKVTGPRTTRFYRRPLEYRLVMQVVKDDAERIDLAYIDPTNGMRYTGFFRKGEKAIVDSVLCNRDNLVGTLVEISFKSLSKIKRNEARLYSVRFERIVQELPPPHGQLILV